MLEIIERHGEWREKQGRSEQKRHGQLLGHDPLRAILQRTKWKQGQEKLLFWGRSYGTVLGSTFATMFPDRIERALLDGVVNADVYFGGGGPSGVVDADAIFDRFVTYCDQAGAAGCPFYSQGGPTAIKEAYQAIESALYNTSLPVFATSARGPEIVTWTDLKIAQRSALYQPLMGFPLLAQHASDLAHGNGSGMADAKHNSRSPSCPSFGCLDAGPWSEQCQVPSENELYASTAILCADADYLPKMDREGLIQYWHSLTADSSTIGDYWASLGVSCAGWNVTAKWKVPGKPSFQLFIWYSIFCPI
jgi:pimeloyl-ACP methyl ester carboxylesterase